MSSIDPDLASALTPQLDAWRATLSSGATRVGWKLGVGDRERIGAGPVIGHLTSATQLAPGATYRPETAVALHADAELALVLAADIDPGASRERIAAAIAGIGAGLEIVDLGPVPGGPRGIVAANVFHRAFALGSLEHCWPGDDLIGTLRVGPMHESALATADYVGLVRSVAEILDAMGLRLEAGDHLMTGSIVQTAIGPGDEVTADLGQLGSVQLTIAA